MTNCYGRELLLSFASHSRSPQPTGSSSLNEPPGGTFTQNALLTNRVARIFEGPRLNPCGSMVEDLLELLCYEDDYTKIAVVTFRKSNRGGSMGPFLRLRGSWDMNNWKIFNLVL